MTREEAYKELKSYRASIVKSESLNRHIRELRSRMYNLRIGTSDGDVVQGGGVSDSLERLIDEIDRYCHKYGEAVVDGEKVRESIESKVEALEFPYGEVLRRKYLDGQSYEKIAVEMSRRYRRNYSYENVRLMTFRAIDKYCEL